MSISASLLFPSQLELRVSWLSFSWFVHQSSLSSVHETNIRYERETLSFNSCDSYISISLMYTCFSLSKMQFSSICLPSLSDFWSWEESNVQVSPSVHLISFSGYTFFADAIHALNWSLGDDHGKDWIDDWVANWILLKLQVNQRPTKNMRTQRSSHKSGDVTALFIQESSIKESLFDTKRDSWKWGREAEDLFLRTSMLPVSISCFVVRLLQHMRVNKSLFLFHHFSVCLQFMSKWRRCFKRCKKRCTCFFFK